MPDIVLSSHAQDMLVERNIREEWVWLVLNSPDTKKRHPDDENMHYTKSIQEREGRVLHVVVNTNVWPNRVVTVFFDRHLRKAK